MAESYGHACADVALDNTWACRGGCDANRSGNHCRQRLNRWGKMNWYHMGIVQYASEGELATIPTHHIENTVILRWGKAAFPAEIPPPR